MARIKKAQKGAGVPKGYVRGEMTGRLIPEKEYRQRENEMAKSLQSMRDQWKKDTTKPKAKPAAKPAPKKKLKAGGKLTKAKGGKEMLTRADGTKSRRGLWDNIRAAAKRNKAAGRPGKKPTAAMLKQERKIKAKGK